MKTKDSVEMPRRATSGSAGYDFHAPHDFDLKPGEWTDVDTGVCFDGSETVLCPICEMALGGGIRTSRPAATPSDSG